VCILAFQYWLFKYRCQCPISARLPLLVVSRGVVTW